MAAGGLSASTDVSTALVGSTNLARYDKADVVLSIIPTASIASTSTNIVLYRRDMNVDGAGGGGTADETAPDASNKNHFMGIFVCKYATTATTTHVIQLTDVPLSGGDCEFYIENGLGVNIPAGWKLLVTPKTIAAA